MRSCSSAIRFAGRYAGIPAVCAISMLGVAGLVGCGTQGDPTVFHPWGWEDLTDARRHLNAFRHVVVASVDNCTWEDLGPHRYTPYHFRATVVRSYKGDWRVSETISFAHHVDAEAPSTSTTSTLSGQWIFVFCNEHTNQEMVLDTGEWGYYRQDLAPALDCLFATSRR